MPFNTATMENILLMKDQIDDAEKEGLITEAEQTAYIAFLIVEAKKTFDQLDTTIG